MEMTLPASETKARRAWASQLPPPIVMMGVPFDQVDTATALRMIGQMIDSRRPHLLATANVDFLAQVQDDSVLRGILVDADLVVCDGTPLVWMSRWLGDPLPERVAGSDLVPLLLDLAQARGFRVYFLGGRDDVIQSAERNILHRWPGLQIAGMYSPPFAPLDKMDHEDICQRIRQARPDILLVSFGCPKQEKWLALNYQRAGVPVSIGVGATIDFLAGSARRAPLWMRSAGLEWVYRVCQEPRRLAGRYWRDIRIAGPGLVRQLLRMRRRQSASLSETADYSPYAGSSVPGSLETPAVIALPERLDALASRDSGLWPAIDASTVILDATRTHFIDSTGTGKLLRFARAAREHGGRCFLAGARPSVLNTLDLMKLRSVFTETSSVADALAVATS